MDLIQNLTSQLGISGDQAKGGAGLIFDLVKSQLSGDEFSQVASAVPEVNEMVPAKAKSGIGGTIGKLASSLTGGNSGLGSLASLAGGFTDLGLDSGMVGKFVPIVLSFLQSKGGDTVKDLVAKVLK